MKAIILAAGRGARLGEHSKNLPKCLLKIGDQCLIDHQIQALRSSGVYHIVLVLGYMSQHVRKHVEKYDDIHFTFLENNEYSCTNTAYSLWIARSEMKEDFIYLNSDVLFHPELIRRLINSGGENTLAVVRKKTGTEEVKVTLQGCRITSIGKDVDSELSYGEFIGVARFSSRIGELFADKLEELACHDDHRMDYFESALQNMVHYIPMTALDVSDMFCIEIDYPDDLEEARAAFVSFTDERGSARLPRILFYIERDLHLPFLEPIHDFIAERYRADMAFSAPPYQIPESGRTGFGLQDHVVRRIRAKAKYFVNPEEFCPDITVVADACYYPVRHCGKIVNVGHGLISKGWFYTESALVRRENLAETICVPGEWHKHIMMKNVFSQIVVSGFIKNDAIVMCDAVQRRYFYEKYKISTANKIILFAPTFNDELSAIPCVKGRIAELASDDTVVIIKLHTMVDRKWKSFYEELERKEKNIINVVEEDFSRAMACAHVLISDVSSVFVEFMLLNKPVVLFNNPLRKNYKHYDENNIEYKLRDAAIQVDTIEEMKLAVQLSLADPGALSTKRINYIQMLNCPQDGRCAQRAALAVMSLAANTHETPSFPSLFSIVVMGDSGLDDCVLKDCIDEIMIKSQDLKYEIIIDSVSVSKNLQVKREGCIIKLLPVSVTRSLLDHVLGDFIVWIRPEIELPKNWLKWMWLYFRWHNDTGAVRALSYNDDCMAIVNNIAAGQRLRTLDDAAQFIAHTLIGNDCELNAIDSRIDCMMISRNAYKRLFDNEDEVPTCTKKYHSLNELCKHLISCDFTVRQATNVFVYPRPLRDLALLRAGCNKKIINHNTKEDCYEYVEEMIKEARSFRENNDYYKAVEYLERAKKIIETETDCDCFMPGEFGTA